MEEKKELNEILLGDDNNQPKKAKKTLLMIAIAIIIIAVLLVILWKLNKVEPKETAMTTDTTIQKLDGIQGSDSFDNNDDFENMSIDDMSKSDEENKFDKIVQDIKSKQLASEQEAQNQTQPDINQDQSTPTSPAVQNSLLDQNTTQHKIQQESIKPGISPTKEEKPVKKAPSQSHTQKQPTPPAQKPKTTPTQAQKIKNGSTATKGFYLQVGAFSKTPNKDFLEKIKKYNYRIQTSVINGQVITKYLIGPYKSRNQASKDVEKVTSQIIKPVYLEVK